METLTPSETARVTELLQRFSPFIGEIKRRFIRTLVIFVISLLFGFIFYEFLIKLVIQLLSLDTINIVFTSPFQFINLAISCGIATGVVVVFPLLIHQVISFIKPALKPKEFKIIMRFLPTSITLFLVGFMFGIVVMKWHIQLFLTRSTSLGIGNVLDISQLISTVLIISSFMGLIFQFPIVILLLNKLGIVHYHQLKSKRKFVYATALLLVIFLPLTSILSDIILAVPIIVLYEITLLISKYYEKRKERAKIHAQKQQEIEEFSSVLDILKEKMEE